MDRQEPAAQTISSPLAAQESTDQLPSTSSQSAERLSASGQLMSIAGQQIITNYIDRPPANWKIAQIDRQVLKMVAKGNHALRIVEEPSFRELIELVSKCPGYKLPTRTSLSSVLMPSVYEELKAKVCAELKAASAVCITTDAWTSRCNQKYVAVAAHFVNAENCTLRAHTLTCIDYSERHTKENLANFLRQVFVTWEIANKIAAVVSDNGANIVGAVKLGQWRSIPCFAHSLNLVVQKGLEAIVELRMKCKTIVEYFHRSAHAQAKLKEAQKQLNMQELKLKNDVVTRWNSTFEMLQRLAKNKDALAIALPYLKPELCLIQTDWILLEKVLPILQPFYEVTVEVSSEKNVTLSTVLLITKIMQSIMSKPFTDFAELELTRIIKSEMMMRFGDIEKNFIYAESTILDPRFKSRGFKNEDNFKDAVRNLKIKLQSVIVADPEDAEEMDIPLGPVDKPSFWDAYDSEFRSVSHPVNKTVASQREMDKYLGEEYLDRKETPMHCRHFCSLRTHLLFSWPNYNRPTKLVAT
ncbi:hypothetical protein ACLKA7_016349 [Drosophila subpalustris]